MPLAAAGWKATPTSPRTTARPRSCPAPPTRAALPPAGSRRRARSASATSSTGPSVISFWFTKGDGCVEQQDVVSRVYERYRGRVGFLSLDVRDDPGTVRELVRERGWKMPVGYDRDGAVAGLYQRRRLSDLRLRLPRRDPAERQHRRPDGGPARRPGSTTCWRHEPRPKRGERLRWPGPRRVDRDGDWEPVARAGLGGAPRRRRVPRARDRLDHRRRRAPARAPEAVRGRLRDLSDRFYGSHAIHLRERPIPWAYRVFFRQIGLDPDRTRTPIEQLALERLDDGAFKSVRHAPGRADDRDVETGVALRAFDGEQVGRLCIRDAGPGESLPGQPGELGPGDAGDRRRARPDRPALRRTGRVERDRAGLATADDRRDPGRRACRRSRSTRRSGWPPRRSRPPESVGSLTAASFAGRVDVIYTRGGSCRICSSEAHPFPLTVGGDERLARAELRRQIGRLEHQLSRLVAEAFPRVEIDAGVAAVAAEPARPRPRRARAGARRARRADRRRPPGSRERDRARDRATASCSSDMLGHPGGVQVACGSPAPTSASPAAAAGTPARASACSGC